MQEEEILASKAETFSVLYDKKVKGFKEKVMVQNDGEKIAKNLDFVENSDFNRGSTEAAVWGFLWENCSKFF